MKTHNFTSPLVVYVPRKTKAPRKISLNLNDYMHIHPQQINLARQVYFDLMYPPMKDLRISNPIEIHLVLFKGSRRKIDRANFLSIVEKFFCDALVYNNVLEDDSDDFILKTTYSTGGVDPKNPRVEITITERS